MATNYPGGLDTTANIIDNAIDGTPTPTTHAAQHNNVADAIIAVENALGINPKGSYASVAAWLADAIVKTPGALQKITPSADTVALVLKQGNSLYTSNLQEWHDSTDAILAFLDKSGNLSVQGLKINGAALASTHLADSGKIQRKGKVASSIASSTESMAVGWDICQGVTPGRVSGATPQTALQVTAPGGSWTLNIAKGCAHIQGTDDDAQGMYGIVQDANTTLALPTHAPTTNPRVDAIVVQYNDSYYTGRTPADAFSFLQITGVETAGANLTNLSGAPSPSAYPSAVLLAYILVNVADSGVGATNVSDQRILSGPTVWGEDNHKYRLGIDAAGNLFHAQVS